MLSCKSCFERSMMLRLRVLLLRIQRSNTALYFRLQQQTALVPAAVAAAMASGEPPSELGTQYAGLPC